MNVWSISASISVASADILTQFGTEHKYHTISTCPNGQIHIIWKSKMAAPAILNFGKMLITPYRIKIYAPDFMWRCITAMRRWPRNQKSKPEVNSRNVIKWKSQKHKCVDLSDYNIYLNQIWYRAQIPHYQHAGAILDFGKTSITPDWIKISASNFTR